MAECWRCGNASVQGAKFCPSCGAPLGTKPPSNPEPEGRVTPEPADPLAQTAPASAEHMAALRAKHPALAEAAKAAAASASKGSRGGTVPLQAHPDRTSQNAVPAASSANPAERRVARTVPDSAAVPAPGAAPQQVSPRAASTFEPAISMPQAAQPATPQGVILTPYTATPAWQPPQQPQQQPPTHPGPYGAPPPAQAPAIRVGARVLVEWSDGQRYPGTIQQCAPGQCLVLFQDGQQRWIDARRVYGV